MTEVKQSKNSKQAALEDELSKKAAEYKESLQRLQAEFENYKKRAEKENVAFKKHTHAEIIKSLLPVLDSFELALKSTSDREKFVKGVELIYAQFFSLLEGYGLCPIKADDCKFDPYRHEVLMQEESNEEGMVLEVLQKGYMLNDMILRHSKVKVGKKKDENKNKQREQ